MNKIAEGYHVKQYQSIYRSTELFANWLENKGFFDSIEGGVKLS